MTRAEDLLQALNGLRKASEHELSGEAQAGALQNVKELFRLAGFDGEGPGDGGGQSLTFAEALAAVRTQAEGELSGNAFYLASKILDNLASLSSVRISAPAEPSEARAPLPEQAAAAERAQAPSRPAPAGATFDELAASAKARVDESAASLGAQVIQPYAAPPPDVYEQDAAQEHPEVQEHHDPFAGVEVEKRSSEPCFMPEIEPIAEQPASSVEPSIAVEVIEASSAREVAEATHDFGSPAVEAEPAPDFAAPRGGPTPHAETPPALERLGAEAAAAAARAAEIEAQAQAQEAPVVTISPEPAPASAPEAPPVTVVKKIDTKPKERQKEQERTFFGIWLEMLFGRRK